MTIWPGTPPGTHELTDQEMAELLLQSLRDVGFYPATLDRRGVGTGKTQEALHGIVQRVPNLETGQAIFIFAPTTALCDEIASRLVSLDEDLQDAHLVYRGRAATDPDLNQPMCPFNEAAELVSMRGGDPERALCKSKKRQCQNFDTCGYRRQKTAIKSGQHKIIIQPHAMLSLARRGGMGDPAMVIIDEDPYSALLDKSEGIKLDDIVAPLKVLPPGPMARPDTNDPTELLTAVLRQVHDVLNRAENVVINEGLPNDKDARVAIELLYRIVRALPCALEPNPSRADIETYENEGRLASRIFKVIKLLMAVLRSRRKKQLIGCRVNERKIEVLLKKHLAEDYISAPTLILSATAQPRILSSWWSWLEWSSTETPGTPHEEVVQFKVKATKGLLCEGNTLMKQVVAMIYRLAHMYRGQGHDGLDGLVVMQKEPSVRLKKVTPDNVGVENFGAVAGINKYENVRFQVIVGRPLPHPSSVELIAEVIKGAPIDRQGFDFFGGWYPKLPTTIKLKSGGGIQTMAEVHPDPMAFAVLKAICHGEIEQANRARGLRRTADNPVTTVYVNEQPAPVAVDTAYEELPFGPRDIMVGKGLVLDTRTRKGQWRVIAAVVPEWFETAKAAERYFQNVLSHVPSTPQTHISTLYGFGELRGLDEPSDVDNDAPFEGYVHAKVTMEGQRYGALVFIDMYFGDPEAHAIRLLGPLSKFKVLGKYPPRKLT
jgi:hypothetical protein